MLSGTRPAKAHHQRSSDPNFALNRKQVVFCAAPGHRRRLRSSDRSSELCFDQKFGCRDGLEGPSARSERPDLLMAIYFEEVGVTAYHDAAARIHDKQILTAAAGILGAEAYHASGVRLR